MPIFDHAYPKIIEITFRLPEFVPACKKSVYSICSFLRQSHFRVPWPNWQHTFLTPPTPKNFNQLLIFVNLHQHGKNKFIPSVHSSDIVNFRDLSLDWPHSFLTMHTPKIFNELLICVNLCHHAKNQLIPSAPFWDRINFRVQRPDWPHLFLTMPNQKIFIHLLIFVNLYQHAKN